MYVQIFPQAFRMAMISIHSILAQSIGIAVGMVLWPGIMSCGLLSNGSLMSIVSFFACPILGYLIASGVSALVLMHRAAAFADHIIAECEAHLGD